MSLASVPGPTEKKEEGRNRRVFVRYPGGRNTAAHLALEESCIFQPVRVLDMSVGGIALLLWEELRQGEDVFVQLTNRRDDSTHELPAKVVHSKKLNNNQWAIGFAFARQLEPAELAQFV